MVLQKGKQMKKFLTARGNGWALIVPKDVIKLLGIIPETAKLKFEIKGGILFVQEVSSNNVDIEKCLIRRFTRKNTSWTLYMPNSIIELLKIKPEEDMVELEVDGQMLMIKKVM